MTSTESLTSLRDAFREAVRNGQSGAAEYAAWVRAHSNERAAVDLHNRDESSRVTKANVHYDAEHAWLVCEGRTLASLADVVGRCVGANEGGQPVTYTAEMHQQRVTEWQARLSAWRGRDCSDVEPRYPNYLLTRSDPLSFIPRSAPSPAPREYGIELTRAVTG